MAMRITGMMSGMDTESIIQELVSARRTKVDKATKAQTKLGWKQDAWKSLNTKLQNLQKKYLGNMRFSDAYSKKTTKVSNSNIVSVITGDKAVNGVQSLEVSQLAKSGYLTGAAISGKDGGELTALSKMSDIMDIEGEGTFSIKGGKGEVDITVNEDTTISDVLTQLKKAGVNASFDAKQQRFFVSSQKSGEKDDFSITALDENGSKALSALGLKVNLNSDKATLKEYQQFAGYYVAGDKNATLDNMKSVLDKAVSDKTEEYLERYKSLQTSLEKATGESAVSIRKELAEIESYINVEEVEGENGETYYKATATDKMTKEIEDRYYKKAAYAAEVMSTYDPRDETKTGATKVTGQDAIILLNGAEFKNNDNTFEINGLTITANNESKGEIVTVTTENDTDGIYDMIKGFLKEYNEIMNEMDKMYNAASARGYEPLTNDEKDAMSDSEIEEWEKKIKDSVLRRDSNLSTVSMALRKIMSDGVKVNGKQMYLSDFGINTLGYFESPDNEKNAYHIDGDPDDASTSANADKLKSMISSDPDTVIEFFSGLSKALYAKMDDLSSRVEGYRSFGSFYDDKKMKEDYDGYKTKISDLEKKLAAYEDKWYSKFSKMETALSKMQSNMSAVTALLGGGG